MKKIVIAFVAGVLFATAGTAAATAVIERVTASVRTDYSVELDGQKVALKNAPLAYNGSSYLPVKEISELLGKEVGFDSGVIKITTPVVADTSGKAVVEEVLSVEVSSLNIHQVKKEIFTAEQMIKILRAKLVYSDLNDEDKTVTEKQISDLEQRLSELEVRKAELEQ